jgi:predicted nucleic acid-binding protein
VKVVVVDASVMLGLLLRQGSSPMLRPALVGTTPFAPQHLDAEILSALQRLVHRREVTGERAGLALARLREAAIERFPLPPLLHEAWTLRENVSAYDALYVALARRLGCPLLTADRRLAGAPDLGIALMLLT